jgi:hypothetical protein
VTHIDMLPCRACITDIVNHVATRVLFSSYDANLYIAITNAENSGCSDSGEEERFNNLCDLRIWKLSTYVIGKLLSRCYIYLP